MTALLTDNLPLLAGAPNGIKKLRELILELAVRGKLVPQDPNDEPASELLKRIEREKTQHIEQKVIRKGKPLPDIEQDEMQFKLPMGWEWIRLGQIGDWGAGATPARGNPSYYGGKMPWFKSGELVADFISDAEETVTELALKECSLRRNKPGDVLIAMYGATIGKTAILSVEGTTNQAVCACTPFNGVFNRYLLLTLKALKSNFIGQGAGGAQPNISREKIVATVTGLPPLAEQHRIVAKVDELMALCDRLEARQADAGSAHAQLVQALLKSLTQAHDAEDFSQNWQRLAEHFHTLFTTESSIDALMQTLLQLAVMGKLVPQDSSDEPASELLKRIAEEKARLVAKGKIKKQKLLAEIAEEDKTLALPIGWEWARLDDVAHVFAGNAFKSEDFQENPGVRVIKITNAGVGEFIETEDYLPSGYEVEYSPFSVKKSDLILALTRPYISTGLKVSKCPPEYDGALLNQRVAAIRFFSNINSDFGFLFFSSPIVLSIYQERFGGSGLQPNLKMSDVTTLLVPIPPAEEQHRIVAKVDQLMALCDQLKARLNQARQVHEQLANALVEQAVA